MNRLTADDTPREQLNEAERVHEAELEAGLGVPGEAAGSVVFAVEDV